MRALTSGSISVSSATASLLALSAARVVTPSGSAGDEIAMNGDIIDSSSTRAARRLTALARTVRKVTTLAWTLFKIDATRLAVLSNENADRRGAGAWPLRYTRQN